MKWVVIRLTLFFIVCFLIIFSFIFWFFLPKSSTSKTKLTVHDQEQIFEFDTRWYQNDAIKVLIDIDHDLEGEAILLIGEKPNVYLKDSILLKDDNTFHFSNYWNSDSCFIKYIPAVGTSGELSMKVKFISL